MQDREIECRFLEIDKEKLIETLHTSGATDHGEKKLREVIFYDAELTWPGQQRFIRIRDNGEHVNICFKHHNGDNIDSALEYETTIGNLEMGVKIIEQTGLVAARRQEKLRHTFTLGKTIIDIDTWPQVPTYVEIEGPDEISIRETATKLALDWNDAVFKNAGKVLKENYGFDVFNMKKFTFDGIEYL